MASRSAVPCEHELRPGTTVCLRCQHAARVAKRARQRRMIARGGAATLVLGMIVAGGVAGIGAWRARNAASGEQATTVVSHTSAATVDSAAGGERATPTAQPTGLNAMPVSATGNAPTTGAPTPVRKVLTPVIPLGQTILRDTMVAERFGDTVRVSFDLLLARTRRPEKFETIMRATLPQVFGAVADSALRALPQGAVARAGDLTTTLPARGLRIPAGNGTTIAVWPETRPGRDGPLVVAYRAVVSQ